MVIKTIRDSSPKMLYPPIPPTAQLCAFLQLFGKSRKAHSIRNLLNKMLQHMQPVEKHENFYIHHALYIYTYFV
jgi:hypothetical protein